MPLANCAAAIVACPFAFLFKGKPTPKFLFNILERESGDGTESPYPSQIALLQT